MKISSKIDYRNQQYCGTIRIRGEANPYSDGDEKVLYIKVRNKDKKKCSAQVEQIIGQWQSSLGFTALFYDIFKRIKRKRMNPGKVMNDYIRLCASKELLKPVRIQLIQIFEENTVDTEVRIGNAVSSGIANLGKGVQAQTYRELHYFHLFTMGKDTMEKYLESGYLEQAVFFGILYQTPLRIREIFELDGECIKGRTLYASSTKVRDKKMSYRLNRKLCRMIQTLSKGRGKLFSRELRYYVSCVSIVCGTSVHEFRQAYLMRKIWLDEEKYKRVLV